MEEIRLYWKVIMMNPAFEANPNPLSNKIESSVGESEVLFFGNMIDLEYLTSTETGEKIPTLKWSDQLTATLHISTLNAATKTVLEEILTGLQQRFISRLTRAGVIQTERSSKIRNLFKRPINNDSKTQLEFEKLKKELALLSPWITANGTEIKIVRNGKEISMVPKGVLWRPISTNNGMTDREQEIVKSRIVDKNERDEHKRELLKLADDLKNGLQSITDVRLQDHLLTLRQDFTLPSSHVALGEKQIKSDMSVPRYIVGPSIGKGGSSRVEMVYDTLMGKFDAAKIISPPPHDDDADFYYALLSSEAKVLAAIKDTLHDSHTPQVYDIFFAENGDLVMIMEYLQGYKEPQKILQDLYLNSSESLDPQQRDKKAAFIRTYLHQSGVIVDKLRALLLHNDIKPQNFLADETGSVQVVDFGISSATDSADNGLFGTLLYMSLNRLLGIKNVEEDVQNDCYSLSVMFYRLIVGTEMLPYASNDLLSFCDALDNIKEDPNSNILNSIETSLSQALTHLGLKDQEIDETIKVFKASIGANGFRFFWESAEDYISVLTKYLPSA